MNNLYELATQLFPICRSITGNGVRETLSILSEIYPMDIVEVPTGTKVFDWEVPKEWNVNDAFVMDKSGNKVIDFEKNNLHLMGYSMPVNKKMTLEELDGYLYSLPEQPEWIPYVTSYYKERFGFCLSHNQRKALEPGLYDVVVDSELKSGHLTYGEIYIEGDTEEEVLISTYVCHPSMGNNEISGPCVSIYLADYISKLVDRKYSYRFVFIPETIGSITYLSKHYKKLKENVIAGFNISCVGDNRTYSIIDTKYGDTYADKIANNVLKFHYPEYKKYSFLSRGSDERQYNAPGIDLPVCGLCRSKYGEYPEYHTSADDLSVISQEGLEGSLELMKEIVMVIEGNEYYKVKTLCEPQLGKRGLYPTHSYKGSADSVQAMMDLIAYSDGKNDLIDISEIIGVPVKELLTIVSRLSENNLLGKV